MNLESLEQLARTDMGNEAGEAVLTLIQGIRALREDHRVMRAFIEKCASANFEYQTRDCRYIGALDGASDALAALKAKV